MKRNEKGQFEPKYPLREHTDLFQQYAEWVMANVDKVTTEERLKAGVRVWLYWCEQTGVGVLREASLTTPRERTDRAFHCVGW